MTTAEATTTAPLTGIAARIDQWSRTARNTPDAADRSLAVEYRNALIAEAKGKGFSTWRLAQLSQLSESTIRGIRAAK